MNLGIGSIGHVAAAVGILGDFKTIRTKYQLSSAIDDASIYSSIHFDEGQNKMVIAARDATTSRMSFQDMVTADSAPLMTTKSTPAVFQPIAGHVYVGRLTNDEVSNSWADTTLFFKMIVLEDGNGATTPEAISVRWEIFTTGPGISIPNLPDDLGFQFQQQAAGAGSAGSAGVVLAILALLCVIALPFLFFLFRRRIVAFSTI